MCVLVYGDNSLVLMSNLLRDMCVECTTHTDILPFLRLVYDPVTHTTSNNAGVETRIQGFGNTSTVEWLSGDHHFAYSKCPDNKSFNVTDVALQRHQQSGDNYCISKIVHVYTLLHTQLLDARV
jgi:hypothetical protein